MGHGALGIGHWALGMGALVRRGSVVGVGRGEAKGYRKSGCPRFYLAFAVATTGSQFPITQGTGKLYWLKGKGQCIQPFPQPRSLFPVSMSNAQCPMPHAQFKTQNSKLKTQTCRD